MHPATWRALATLAVRAAVRPIGHPRRARSGRAGTSWDQSLGSSRTRSRGSTATTSSSASSPTRQRDLVLGRAPGEGVVHLPGAEVSFELPGRGRVVFHTDAYKTLHANLHAIALGLEALRAVDRHGITSTAEQYAGFAQLTAGSGDPERGASSSGSPAASQRRSRSTTPTTAVIRATWPTSRRSGGLERAPDGPNGPAGAPRGCPRDRGSGSAESCTRSRAPQRRWLPHPTPGCLECQRPRSGDSPPTSGGSIEGSPR
jgi:hypothetical protein